MSQKKKVLIAFGSRFGSTRIVSKDIAKYLNEKGIDVDLVDLKKNKIKSIEGYDGIIIGSGIMMYMWVGKAKRFLKKLKKTSIPYAIFTCSGMAIEEREKAREKYMQKKIDQYQLKPKVWEAICPVIDLSDREPGEKSSTGQSKIKLFEEMVVKAGKEFNQYGVNDLRDEQLFNEFLNNLSEMF